MKFQKKSSSPETHSLRTFDVIRFETSSDEKIHEQVQVAVEDSITIDVRDVGAYTIMCSKTDTVPLAAGFILSEGIIGSMEDIEDISECMDAVGVVNVKLRDPASVSTRGRNLTVSSSCGLCGSRESIDSIISGIGPVHGNEKIKYGLLVDSVEKMRAKQEAFRYTGGTHAAAVFDAEGGLLSLGEDVGRHNALDKASGKCLLGGTLDRACFATLSGRLSLEMIIKAARARLQILAAVSAPSSLAVESARRLNITVCGFTRGSRITVFSHPDRVLL